jgi:hypothetical protein
MTIARLKTPYDALLRPLPKNPPLLRQLKNVMKKTPVRTPASNKLSSDFAVRLPLEERVLNVEFSFRGGTPSIDHGQFLEYRKYAFANMLA